MAPFNQIDPHQPRLSPSMPLMIFAVGGRTPPEAQGACVAITQLDGVHEEQRRIIAAAGAHARRLEAPLGVLTFDPNLTNPHAADRLMSLSQYARTLEALKVDMLYVASPHYLHPDNVGAFASSVLSERLQARHVTLGLDPADDGDALSAVLIRNSENLDFSISIINGLPLSRSGFSPSAQARHALKAGRPEIAANVLGRPFAIEGVVVEGQKLGRQLGFPTANVSAGTYFRPRLGAYATRTRLQDGRVLPGVSSFGVNPTTGLVSARLEVHLFDFDEDIYGQVIETYLVAFLRPEAKFDGLDDLVAQIARDAAAARIVLDDHARRLTVSGRK